VTTKDTSAGLTDKIGTLSGRVDSILSQQDSQLTKLDSKR